MFPWQSRSFSVTLRAGGTGLVEDDQRALMRVVFLTSSITLAVFGVLQLIYGRYLLSLFELVSCVALLWCSWRVASAVRPVMWIYFYLLPLYCFLIYIILMPGASYTAFVWIYLIPILSYLLLGRFMGLLLALPFISAAALAYLYRFGVPTEAAGLIDLGNSLLCGLLILLFVHLYESRRALAQLALEHMAQVDALTGVANRGSFQKALERGVDDAARSGSGLVLVMMDVDFFKRVNDRWGHDVGDAALRHICSCIAQRLRRTDTLGRLGGEEFGILLRNTDARAAQELVESLRRQIVITPLEHQGQQILLSATFGLAQMGVDGATAFELYRCADQRLYRGKASGRNQLVDRDPGFG
ncbi:GGDEF domain-containing protein [Halopseudomonas sp.]|uniref:GGDEF domain-containing protein n=1 Tax=Halopseudomonas sp. TaxID=2901191 RepID=UPI0039E47638